MKKYLLLFIIFSSSALSQEADLSSFDDLYKYQQKINDDREISLEDKTYKISLAKKQLEKVIVKKAFEKALSEEAITSSLTPSEKQIMLNKPGIFQPELNKKTSLSEIKNKILELSIDKIPDISKEDQKKYNREEMKERLKDKFLAVKNLDELDLLYKEERAWMKSEDYFQFLSALPLFYQEAYQRIISEMAKKPVNENIEN